MVGIGVGSGYDINARVLARHMSKHIPGNPQIIVQNQPGAGSLTMTNQLYAAGPFDGTTLGASFNGLPTPAATVEEAHNRLMLTKALDLSAKRKQPVKLPLDPDEEKRAA